MTEKFYGVEVTFEKNQLSRSTIEQLKERLFELGKYENAHSNFDCRDPYGKIADVYLFQKNNRLYARGAKCTLVLRNPENVYEVLNKSRLVKGKITLVYREN